MLLTCYLPIRTWCCWCCSWMLECASHLPSPCNTTFSTRTTTTSYATTSATIILETPTTSLLFSPFLPTSLIRHSLTPPTTTQSTITTINILHLHWPYNHHFISRLFPTTIITTTRTTTTTPLTTTTTTTKPIFQTFFLTSFLRRTTLLTPINYSTLHFSTTIITTTPFSPIIIIIITHFSLTTQITTPTTRLFWIQSTTTTTTTFSTTTPTSRGMYGATMQSPCGQRLQYHHQHCLPFPQTSFLTTVCLITIIFLLIITTIFFIIINFLFIIIIILFIIIIGIIIIIVVVITNMFSFTGWVCYFILFNIHFNFQWCPSSTSHKFIAYHLTPNHSIIILTPPKHYHDHHNHSIIPNTSIAASPALKQYHYSTTITTTTASSSGVPDSLLALPVALSTRQLLSSSNAFSVPPSIFLSPSLPPCFLPATQPWFNLDLVAHVCNNNNNNNSNVANVANVANNRIKPQHISAEKLLDHHNYNLIKNHYSNTPFNQDPLNDFKASPNNPPPFRWAIPTCLGCINTKYARIYASY